LCKNLPRFCTLSQSRIEIDATGLPTQRWNNHVFLLARFVETLWLHENIILLYKKVVKIGINAAWGWHGNILVTRRPNSVYRRLGRTITPKLPLVNWNISANQALEDLIFLKWEQFLSILYKKIRKTGTWSPKAK
jgi:hypothetical protein